MGSRSYVFSLSLLALLPTLPAQAQAPAAHALRHGAALAPAYGDDYGYWRQQVRVASPQRRARWNAPPAGAVRVHHKRFDARWHWRSADRHRVVYTYYRGELWFLDPTTGWAWSVDRYGIVYTADPYRGWVYSLGPLTRWTADLLYFFDLYVFDRGYWYCRDYDYFVDLWEDRPRYGYYTYDTAYSTLWGWETYWRSPAFYSYSNRFSGVWIGHVRRNNDYVRRYPHYRREMLDSIGLPAVQAAPPRQVSPRAVATTAYWEARDLAAAGFAPPPRGRDTGRAWEAGTVVDTRDAPARTVEAGAPMPGFGAPFPDGTYGFGVRPDGQTPPTAERPGRGGRDEGRVTEPGLRQPGAGGWTEGRDRDESAKPPQFEDPRDTPRDAPVFEPSAEAPKEPRFQTRDEPRYEAPRFDPPVESPRERNFGVRDEPRFEAPREEPRFEAPREEPRFEAPREEPRFETPREEPRFEAPREEPRFEAPREEPRFEAPREEPRFEAPREEPRFEAPREEPRFEAPREEPRFEAPSEPQKEERKDEGSARGALTGLGVENEG